MRGANRWAELATLRDSTAGFIIADELHLDVHVVASLEVRAFFEALSLLKGAHYMITVQATKSQNRLILGCCLPRSAVT